MVGRRRPRQPSPSSSSSSSSDEESSPKRASVVTRDWPNLLVTGTPGTGKSTLAKRLAREMEFFDWINVGEYAKERGHLGHWDEQRQCHELEEEPLLDDLEDEVGQKGGRIVDHHVTDFFPERFFDAVFVLRADNAVLHDRLAERKYPTAKLKENLECEIFQTVLDEARESYEPEIVHELRSDTQEELEDNVKRIKTWVEAWRKDNGKVK